MRVLMVNRNDMHSAPGGDTVQMTQTAVELRKLGVAVEIRPISDMPAPGEFDLIHVFNWETFESLFSQEGIRISGGPPLVLSPILWFHTGHWYAAAASSKLGWRTLTNALGSRATRNLYEWWQEAKTRWSARGRLMRKALSIPAQLLPNSNMECEHLVRVFGIGRKIQSRCTIVPNGVVRSLFEPKPRPSDQFMDEHGNKPFILQVGRIQSAKNQLGLIQALYDLDLPIVFVGQPSPYESEYVDLCHLQGKKRGRVYFVPPKPAEELAGIYAAAAVHVLPSWRETPGLASLEAAAAGCRIVSTVNGSTREYFGDEAWYCDPRDPQSIRRAVLEALNSTASGRLRERILSYFTWDVAAQRTFEAYRRAVE